MSLPIDARDVRQPARADFLFPAKSGVAKSVVTLILPEQSQNVLENTGAGRALV